MFAVVDCHLKSTISEQKICVICFEYSLAPFVSCKHEEKILFLIYGNMNEKINASEDWKRLSLNVIRNHKEKNRTLSNFLKMYFTTKWILKYPQFMQNYHFSDDTQTWAKNLDLQSKIAERLKYPKCLTFLGKISLNFGLFEWEKSQRFPPKTILFLIMVVIVFTKLCTMLVFTN